MVGLFHIRRIEVIPEPEDQNDKVTSPFSDEGREPCCDPSVKVGLQEAAVREWPYEIADGSGQIVLALPFESAIRTDLPLPDRSKD